MRRPSALALVVLATCTGVFAASCSSAKGGASGSGPQGPPATELVPGPGQTFVKGAVTRFRADDAQMGEPLRTPFTITALERGTGNITIENALVGGKRSTISWATGTPLPISGGGGLDLGASHVDVDGGGVTWSLDGPGRTFVPGAYGANAPVAVGTAGIATPQDSVQFTADERTVLTGRGGVVVHLNPRRLQIQGPGRISVDGRLTVQTPSSKRTAGSVGFGDGPFQVTLVPAGGGVQVDAILQGPVNVR